MKIWMTHYDDGKQKYQSHEVSIGVRYEESDRDNIDFDIYSGAEHCVEFADFPVGYGENKEEAIQNFKDKLKYMVDSFNHILDQVNNNSDIEFRDLNGND